MEQVRAWLTTTPGRVTSVIVAIAFGYLGFRQIQDTFGASEIEEAMASPRFVCSETGKSFTLKAYVGMTWPVDSPYSGKKTGYPAEMCFWTKDGKIKSDPTYVYVKAYSGVREPTFCPDCGRLVTQRNPAGDPGQPPPTEAEFKEQKKNK